MSEYDKPIEVKIETQEIELVKQDFSQYVGKSSFIVNVKTIKGQYQGRDSYYAKVECASVGTFVNKDKKKVNIIPSRNFGIQQDEKGNFGWGKETKLGQFLVSKKAKNLEELKGKKVLVQMDDKGYLTFI
jgi:hypothetical protein